MLGSLIFGDSIEFAHISSAMPHAEQVLGFSQAASFPAAQFASAIGWGWVSDNHGRKVRSDSN